MDEVTGPVIAIALVLCAVFVPTAFMAGISGQFFKQFALTIAASTIISAFNSLTLSPALCATLLKPHGHGEHGARRTPRRGAAAAGHRDHRRPDRVCLPRWRRSATCSASKSAAGHGEPAAPRQRQRRSSGRCRAGVFAVGGVVGWFVGRFVNAAAGAFFHGFNRAFDVAIAGLRHGRRGCSCASASSCCSSMAACWS